MTTLSFQVLSTAAQLAALKGEWDALLTTSGCSNPFLSWEWVAAWHEHMRRGPLYLVVGRRGERLVGVVPLEQVDYRLVLGVKIPTLQALGRGSYQFELRGFLCAPGEEAELIRALVAHLRAHHPPWVCVLLEGFVEEDAAHQSIRTLVDDRASGLGQGAMPSYVLQLPATWDAFRGGLKRNIKESLRKCYNSLARDGRVLSFEVWHEPERLTEAIDRFLALHRMRANQTDTSVPHRDYFGSPNEERFFRAAAPQLLARGILHPFFLKVDGEIVAARLGLELGGELYLYYSGFHVGFGKYSVGTTIIAECIKWAISRKLQRVNLSTGKDISKTRWGGVEQTHRAVVMVSDGFVPRTLFSAYETVGRRNPDLMKKVFGALPGASRWARAAARLWARSPQT